MSDHISKEVKEKLWEMVQPVVKEPLSLLIVYPGMKAKKGQTKAEATLEAVMEAARDLYFMGLERGYDMAKEVFAEPERAAEED